MESPSYSPFTSDVIQLIAYDRFCVCGSEEHGDHAEACQISTTTFHVHSHLLCGNSPIFDRALNGVMKEAIERKYHLKEHGRATVNKALEYMYTGTYLTPSPKKRSPSAQSPPTPQPSMIRTMHRTPYTSQQSPRLDVLLRLYDTIGDSRLIAANQTEGPACRGDGFNSARMPQYPLKDWRFLPSLQGELYLYNFAHMYDFPGLQNLAYYHIENILCGMFLTSISQQSVDEDIVPFLRSVYELTDGSTDEPLRKLMSTFVAWKLKELHGKALSDLVTEGGDIAVDIIKALAARV